MTPLVQNSSQAANSYFDAHAGTGLFGSVENPRENDCAFRITQVRETRRGATHSSSRRRLPKSPEDDLDSITQAFGDWSLFGRTKEDVILNPGFQAGLNIQFKEFVLCEDGQVPVVTLDDIKGSKVNLPPPPPYDIEDSFPPGGPDAAIGFGSIPLLHGVDVTDDLNLVHPAFDIPPDGSEETMEFGYQQRLFTQLNPIPSTTEISPALHNYVISSDIASPSKTNLELQVNNRTTRDVPTLHLDLQGINNNFTLTYTSALPLYHTDTRNEQVAAPGEGTNPLISQALLNSWNTVPSSSSVQYPFEQTPAPAELPFPIKSPAHSSQPNSLGSQDLQPLFDQPAHDAAPENPSTNIEPQLYNQYDGFFSSSCWSPPPGLSPSYTDGSQDSTLCTPISGLSSTTLSSVASSHPVAPATPYQHPLPPQDVLTNIPPCVNPAFLTLNDIHLGEPFQPCIATEENPRYRTVQRASQVHELIMVQVAPYPIGPSTSKPKIAASTKGKGKFTAKSDEDDSASDGADARKKGPQKKKKRDEADKVRCEINGCNGTFFSNWELKRHHRTVHGIGEDTANTAVCPKCGRHFASRRKDSVDRHLELNACGKRNPRKSPKRFTTGETS
ncbi:hypothetical protein C0992_004173 [Termitomyces sp. T32_za158]|nr:hypothetical protein C0992_004173 [Termitomyces sp. T32_za158]